jgi:hypothetical protein
MSRPVQLDPFFDDEGAEPGRVGAQRQVAGPTANYQPASAMEMLDGRKASQLIRSGRGLEGTLIPAATPGGVPGGFNPHDVSDIEVHIDPHLPAQSTTVRLGDINDATMAVARGLAAQAVPQPRSLSARRMQASAVFHALGQMQEDEALREANYEPLASPAAPRVVRSSGREPVRPQPVHEFQPPAAAPPPAGPRASSQPRTSPLTAFRAPPPLPAAAPAYEAPAAAPAAAAAPILEPSHQVIFELIMQDESTQVMEAWYHDVQFVPNVEEPKNVLLIYDNRSRGHKWFPSGQLKMGMEVVGDQRAHLVYPTGLEYRRGDEEICMLLIERSVPITE